MSCEQAPNSSATGALDTVVITLDMKPPNNTQRQSRQKQSDSERLT